MLDILQVILWSVTYVLICFYGIKYRNERKRMMPLFSGSLNIAWEINAFVWSKGFWGHIIWLLLDVIIFSLNVSSIKKVKNKVFYGIITLGLAGIMAGIFRITVIDGMLASAFALDLIIAMEYVIKAKSISKRGKAQIAIFKLLGDVCAWLFYMKNSEFVGIVGFVILLLNLFYLAYCLEEKRDAAGR